jgi:hypothetical protein
VQGDEGDHPAPSSCAETGRGIGLALVGVGGLASCGRRSL